MNNIDENFEIINIKDAQSETFVINPNNVINSTVYVLYDILNGVPRFERLKMPKEKNQNLYGNMFNDFNIGYKNYLVQPTVIPIQVNGRHAAYFDPKNLEDVINESFVELSNFENKLMNNSIIQFKNNGYKLKAMYLNFENAQLNENLTLNGFFKEFTIYKRIGMILYHTPDYESSYISKNPFLV